MYEFICVEIKINLNSNPDYYELRLHEQNGYPDEDCPALDRTRKITGFADQLEFDSSFCLCEISGVIPTNSTKGLNNMMRRFSHVAAKRKNKEVCHVHV